MTIEQALMIATAVQAVATVVLVCVTVFYAIQTKKTVDAMEKANKSAFLPVIMIGWNAASNEKVLHVSLSNVGRGLAKRQIKVVFPGVAPIYLNSIRPSAADDDKEKVSITYDKAYILQLPESERKIVVHYRDIFDRELRTEATLIEKPREVHGHTVTCLGWDTWQPIIP